MADTNVQADDTAESPVPAGGNEPTETVTMRMADDTAPKEDDGKGEEGQIPSWRLKEEADNRRAAEDRAAQLERMLTIANARNNTNPQVTEAGGELEAKYQRFGDREEGSKEAYDAVVETTREEITDSEARLLNRVGQMIEQRVGAVTATMTTAQALSRMKAEGLLDNPAEVEMGRRMSAKMQENQAWGLAENQQNLIDTVYMEMLRGGVIKPRVGPPPVAPGNPSDSGNMPLQPGQGSGVARSQGDIDQELLAIQKAYPKTLGSLSIEQLREIDPGDNAPARQQAPPVQYVHSR